MKEQVRIREEVHIREKVVHNSAAVSSFVRGWFSFRVAPLIPFAHSFRSLRKLKGTQLDTNATINTNKKHQAPKSDRKKNVKGNRLHRRAHHHTPFVTTTKHALVVLAMFGLFLWFMFLCLGGWCAFGLSVAFLDVSTLGRTTFPHVFV